MSSPVRLSVVCNVRAPYSGDMKFSAMFLRHLVPWPPFDVQVKFNGDVAGEPLHRGSETRGVAEYSDFGLIERYISEMVQDRS